MKTFISKVVLAMLVVTVFITGSVHAATDTTAPIVGMSVASGSTIQAGTILDIIIRDDESNVASAKYYWAYKDSARTKVSGTNEVNISGLVNRNPYIGKVPAAPSETGEYLLCISTKNGQGLAANKEFTYYVVGSTSSSKPVITSNPANNSTIALGSTVRIMIKDSNSKIVEATYDVNGIEQKVTDAANYEWTINLATFNLEKTYTVKITAKNQAGVQTSQTFTYYVKNNSSDTVAPTISAYRNDKMIMVTVKDDKSLKSVRYSWDSTSKYIELPNVSGSTYNCGIALPSTSGTHVLRVIATDGNGNNSEAVSFSYSVNATSKPVITANYSNGSTIKLLTTVEFRITDSQSKIVEASYDCNGIYQKIDKAPNYEWIIKLTNFNLVQKYTVKVTAKNADGVETTETFVYYVEGSAQKDNVRPTISVNPANGSTVSGGTRIKATLKDDVALGNVRYNWKGESEKTLTLSGTNTVLELPRISDNNGTYYMYITLTDATGNSTSEVYTYYVREDSGDIPTVDADPSKGTLEYGDRITITAEDDDGIDYVEYYWDDEDDVTKKYSDEFTVKVPSDEGKHYLYVRATDENGNRCSYERFTYTIEENRYPGNPDIIGDINKRVRDLRVEIRNGDDKIKFEPEEEILYYVDYYNGSSSKISNAKIVVDLPTYLEGIKASDSGKVSSNKITWNLGTLNKGEYGRISFIAEYTSEKYNEKIITVPAKIYAGSSLKDTSTVKNLIYCEDASGSGSHAAYCVGYPSGAFRPNGNITRAELATMVANIEGISSTYRGQFTDVQGHWAADKIQACVERGYMNGLGYNYFGAEQYATRADLAYAIAAILDVEDLEPVFVYSSDVNYSDARCAMEQLLRLGIMDGYADGTSKPEKNITRAEAVTIINNYLFRGELYTRGYNYSYNYNTNYNYGGNSYILQFTDLTPSHWAYGHIMEATNNHRYVRTIDGNEEVL